MELSHPNISLGPLKVRISMAESCHGKYVSLGGFHKWGCPKNAWFTVENPIQMDDNWGYPYFRKPPHIDRYYQFYSWTEDHCSPIYPTKWTNWLNDATIGGTCFNHVISQDETQFLQSTS